jgi:hypothetical protein
VVMMDGWEMEDGKGKRDEDKQVKGKGQAALSSNLAVDGRRGDGSLRDSSLRDDSRRGDCRRRDGLRSHRGGYWSWGDAGGRRRNYAYLEIVLHGLTTDPIIEYDTHAGGRWKYCG